MFVAANTPRAVGSPIGRPPSLPLTLFGVASALAAPLLTAARGLQQQSYDAPTTDNTSFSPDTIKTGRLALAGIAAEALGIICCIALYCRVSKSRKPQGGQDGVELTQTGQRPSAPPDPQSVGTAATLGGCLPF